MDGRRALKPRGSCVVVADSLEPVS
jgi:hypothetical protein